MLIVDYYSLDLQIIKEPEGFLKMYRASILENGEIKATQSFELRRDLKLIQMLGRIEEKIVVPIRQPNEIIHIEFGKMLYNAVFSGKLEDYFNKRLNKAQEENCGLRVSMIFSEDIPEIATLPWEYLHNGNEFLVIREGILLSRLPMEVNKINSLPINSILRMLVIISAPDDPSISPLNTEKEQEIILEALDKLQQEKKIKVDFTEDATIENVQSYLNEQNYHIVHFIGHGASINGKGHLVFETEHRNAMYLDNEKLAELFLNKGIRLVLLNSCESAKGSNKKAYGDLASMLSKMGIPAVVAMQYSVNNDVATQFAYAFYSAIVCGKSVDSALNEARILMKNLPKSNGLDFATPVMYLLDHKCVQIEEIKPDFSESENKPMKLSDLKVMKTGFIARKKELRILESGFESNTKKVAIIHGFGGIGKTVLATKFAQRMNKCFDGIFGMKCTSSTRPEDILSEINNFLLTEEKLEHKPLLNQQFSLEVKTSVLVNVLNENRFLIIFDKFEDCLDEDLKNIKSSELKIFIQHLLYKVINTKFIITTRYDFDPLDGKLSENIEHISLSELRFPQTNWLMNKYAKLANLSIWKKREIYNIIGGHPWAVEQFVKFASIESKESLRLNLKSLRRELIEFTLLDKLFAKLDSDAKNLFLCASIYKEPVPIKALSWIVGNDKDENPSFRESLQKLIQWGFISKEIEYGEEIYTEYSVVKNYAKDILEEEKLDTKNLLLRAAEYYENLSVRTGDLWNYLRARDYYFQVGEWEKAYEIVKKISYYLIICGYNDLAISLLNESINTTSEETIADAKQLLAINYFNLGNLKEALKIFNDLKQKYVTNSDNRETAIILGSIGRVYQDEGNFDEAIEMYEQSIKIGENLGDKGIIAFAYHHIGEIYQLKGDLDKAIDTQAYALKIYKEIDEKGGVALALHQLGIIHQRRGNFEKAIKIYNQSTKMFDEIEDKSGIAMALHALGIIHQHEGNLENAIEDYMQSLEIQKELGNIRGIAFTSHQLGIIHEIQGNLDASKIMFEESLKIKEQIGEKTGIASTLHHLGNIYYEQGNYKEAIKKYNQSLKVKEDLGDKNGIALTLAQLGNICMELGMLRKAKEIYTQSLRIFEETGDKKGTAEIVHQLGIIYQRRCNYQKAIKMYNQSINIFKKIRDKNGVAHTLHQLGMIHQDQGEYEEAVKKYNQSLKIREELGDKSGIAHTLHALGSIHQEQGDYEESVKMYTQTIRIFKEIGNKRTAAELLRQLGSLHAYYDNYKEAKKILNQSLDLFEELEDIKETAITLCLLGTVHKGQGKLKEALELYNFSIILFDDIGEKTKAAVVLGFMGNVYEIMEDYEHALKAYLTAFLLSKQLNSSYSQKAYVLISELRDKMREDEFNAILEKVKDLYDS